MKKLSIILACVLVALISCTKGKEVHPEIGDGNDEIVTVGMKDVHVEYARTDHAELSRAVFHYCPADANGNAQQFETAEMTKKETFFELTLNDLLSDTLYWYYYELFPNGGSATNTAQKSFCTQAYDAPEPPTPPTPPSGVPEGAINGLFTINENGDQVYFSQGNLQYQASTNTWRFAENQWDYVGGVDEGVEFGNVFENGVKCDNALISSNYNGWIDMFGWGTSGYEHGSICYQPWAIMEGNNYYYAYGSYTDSLNCHSGQADWGYNRIENGGNVENNWHTPTLAEWSYLFNSRNTASGIRFVKAKVNEVDGIVLLPDGFLESGHTFNSINQEEAQFSSNVIGYEDWVALENEGAVFLPVTGYRDCTDHSWIIASTCGFYWPSAFSGHVIGEDGIPCWCVFIGNDGIVIGNGSNRGNGHSVRLVRDAN